MRVLTLSWEYPPVLEGGLGRHVRKLSEALAGEGVEVHVVTRGAGRLPSEEVRRGVVVHRVAEPPFPHDVERFLRWVADMNGHMHSLASELADRLEPDLVHSHDWLVADAAEQVARAAGVPWLVTIHATEFGRHQGWVRRHPQSQIHGVERRMARRADRLITCSEYMAGHVSRTFGVPPERISAIPNGIDPRELEPVEDDGDGGGSAVAALRSRFARPDELLVLMVGRLVYEKGFHLALDALAPVAQARGNVRFVVAGSGGSEAELKRQARRLGLSRYGTFLGWVGDDTLHALYRAAEICIVPSIYEPFGLVALEAMASGCLAVVADTGGLREVVPADGTAGLRFPARDADALRMILERMLTDDRARAQLIAEAREHVLRFDWTEVAQCTLRVYRTLVTRSGALR